MEFRILKGNIADAKADAIVLPANTRLKEGSGASEAIFKAAGRKALKKACHEIGFCEMGSAVPTLGYDLAAKYIIHAVVPKWKDGKHGEYDMLSTAYASALEVADVMECKSIAFPLLASGNNGFDINLAFEIAVKNFEQFQPKNLEEILLIVYGNNTAKVIKNKGYEVSLLPVDLNREREEYEAVKERQKEKQKMVDGVKEVAVLFAEEQVKKGIEYFKVPENREKVVQFGQSIFRLVWEKAAAESSASYGARDNMTE